MVEAFTIIIPKIAKKIYYLAILYATIIYYKGKVADDTASGIIDLPGNSILSHYDFIIVGGGSAGNNNKINIISFNAYKHNKPNKTK